jgi:DNA-3-methyladenine glycosylase II
MDPEFERRLVAAQQHLAKNDPKQKQLIGRYGNCQIKPHTDYYSELVTSIVGQQLSIKAAAAIWQRVLVLAGGNLPTPQQLMDIKEQDLRQAGLSGAKVSYVKDLALATQDGRLDLEHIAGLPNDQIIAQLTAVKGIGEWSAHMFMIFGLGRLDILPWGDLGIRKAAQKVYSLKYLPGQAELEKIAKKLNWPPYQSVACWYLWKSLENDGIRIKKDK